MCSMEDDPNVIDEPVTLDNMFTLAPPDWFEELVEDTLQSMAEGNLISPIEPDECVNPLCFCRNSRRRTTIDVE